MNEQHQLRKGQVWTLPTGTTITPIFKTVKIHWIDKERNLIHYHYVENNGVQRIQNLPLTTFAKIIKDPQAKLIEETTDHD